MIYSQDIVGAKRQTKVILSIFLCFDIFILISAVTNLTWLSASQAEDGYFQQVKTTAIPLMLGFFTSSLFSNRSVPYRWG